MHLVMFDVDGTLCDTHDIDDKIYFQAIKDVLELERPESLINFSHRSDPGILTEMVMDSLERDITTKEHNAVRDHFSDVIMDILIEDASLSPEIPGALKLFNQLRETEDVIVAIATGGWGPSACFKLATAGFDIERVAMASADDDFERKEIMKICQDRALKRAKVQQFKSITYVGDGSWDEDATLELGWRFIGVGERIKDTKNWIADFSKADADYFYQS